MLYLALKYLHILLAIAAIGANLTYGLWFALARRNPRWWEAALKGVAFVDRRLANPSYLGVLATGIAMALHAGLPLTTPWLLWPLILYALAALYGTFFVEPLLRRQIEALEKHGADSVEFQALILRSRRMAPLPALIVLGILYFMIVKPA